MDYLTVKEISEKWGVTERMINYYCTAGRITGALKRGKMWFVPMVAEKPIDNRKNNGRKTSEEQNDENNSNH